MAMVIAALYAAHRTALVRMLTAVVGDVETAEDVCQDVFVFALSGDNDPSRGDDPVLWLYYTARQLAQQALYHRQRSRQALLSACQLVDDPTDRALDTLPGAAVLHGLPEPWRAALILRVLGFSREDAALVLRCTADNVRVYLFSARRMLQTYASVVTRRGRPAVVVQGGAPPPKGKFDDGTRDLPAAEPPNARGPGYRPQRPGLMVGQALVIGRGNRAIWIDWRDTPGGFMRPPSRTCATRYLRRSNNKKDTWKYDNETQRRRNCDPLVPANRGHG